MYIELEFTNGLVHEDLFFLTFLCYVLAYSYMNGYFRLVCGINFHLDRIHCNCTFTNFHSGLQDTIQIMHLLFNSPIRGDSISIYRSLLLRTFA